MSNSLCASDRPSIIVLGLMQSEMERYLASDTKSNKTNDYSMGILQLLKVVVDLKRTCNVIMSYVSYPHKCLIRNFLKVKLKFLIRHFM